MKTETLQPIIRSMMSMWKQHIIKHLLLLLIQFCF